MLLLLLISYPSNLNLLALSWNYEDEHFERIHWIIPEIQELIIDKYAELAKSNSFAKYVMKIFDEQIKNNYYFNTYSNIIDEQIGETRNRL